MPPLLLVVVGAVAVLFLVTALLQWLWNRTMPDVFRLPPLSYWQALRLLILAVILFGGPGAAT